MKNGRIAVSVVFGLVTLLSVSAQEPKRNSSYAPVDIKEPFETIMARMKAAKPDVMKRQMTLLEERDREDEDEAATLKRLMG